jgi:hypothetical protein
MTPRRRQEPLVRYMPLIGSPGWMTEAEAKALLEREDRLYLAWVDIARETGDPDVVPKRPWGPPHIRYPQERRSR